MANVGAQTQHFPKIVLLLEPKLKNNKFATRPQMRDLIARLHNCAKRPSPRVEQPSYFTIVRFTIVRFTNNVKYKITEVSYQKLIIVNIIKLPSSCLG